MKQADLKKGITVIGMEILLSMFLFFVFSIANSGALAADSQITQYRPNEKLSELLDREGMKLGLSLEKAQKRYSLYGHKNFSYPDKTFWAKDSRRPTKPMFLQGAIHYDKGKLYKLKKLVALVRGTIDVQSVYNDFYRKYGKPTSGAKYKLIHNGRYLVFQIDVESSAYRGESTIKYYLTDVTHELEKSVKEKERAKKLKNVF